MMTKAEWVEKRLPVFEALGRSNEQLTQEEAQYCFDQAQFLTAKPLPKRQVILVDSPLQAWWLAHVLSGKPRYTRSEAVEAGRRGLLDGMQDGFTVRRILRDVPKPCELGEPLILSNGYRATGMPVADIPHEYHGYPMEIIDDLQDIREAGSGDYWMSFHTRYPECRADWVFDAFLKAVEWKAQQAFPYLIDAGDGNDLKRRAVSAAATLLVMPHATSQGFKVGETLRCWMEGRPFTTLSSSWATQPLGSPEEEARAWRQYTMTRLLDMNLCFPVQAVIAAVIDGVQNLLSGHRPHRSASWDQPNWKGSAMARKMAAQDWLDHAETLPPDILQITRQAREAVLRLGMTYVLPDVAIVSQKPIRGSHNPPVLRNSDDGTPLWEFADGVAEWRLHDRVVPQWLAETPAEELEIGSLGRISNADTRTEFVRKIGIERLLEKGKMVDSHEAYNEPWWTKSQYQLWDMGKVFGRSYQPYLRMQNQTTGVWHVEAVAPHCRTLPEAIRNRFGGREVKIRSIH